VLASPLPSGSGVCDGDRRTRRRWSSAALLLNLLLAGELERARGVAGLLLDNGIDLPRVVGPLALAPLAPLAPLAVPLLMKLLRPTLPAVAEDVAVNARD